MLTLQAFIQSPGETFLNLGFITIRWYGLLISVSVLTGRGASEAIIKYADLVTEMKLIKHPFKEQGIKAQKCIEF